MEAAGVASERRITGRSLPKSRQWLQWLAYHLDELPGDHGWICQARDTTIGLHHAIVSAARRLRKNPTWDLQGTMTDDTERLADGALRWARTAQALGSRADIPDRFRPLVEVLQGACNQQVRLATEIDRMQRDGELVVDVTLDRAAQQLVEVG
jgi:hypothetical protein